MSKNRSTIKLGYLENRNRSLAFWLIIVVKLSRDTFVYRQLYRSHIVSMASDFSSLFAYCLMTFIFNGLSSV